LVKCGNVFVKRTTRYERKYNKIEEKYGKKTSRSGVCKKNSKKELKRYCFFSGDVVL